MLVDPWGEVMDQRTDDGEGLVIGEVSYPRLQDVRGRLPALNHRVL